MKPKPILWLLSIGTFLTVLATLPNARSQTTASPISAAQVLSPTSRSAFPLNPLVLMGTETNSFYWRDTGSANQPGAVISFPTSFADRPILHASLDESVDDFGATWLRVTDWHNNRSIVRFDGPTEILHWMAIDEGIHTISGKQVMAGRETNVSSGSPIFFPQNFDSPPTVLLFVDETGDNNGGARIRVIGGQPVSGVLVWTDLPVDAVHWIAMEAGTYERGPFRWEAGTVPGLFDGATVAFTQSFSTQPGVLLTIHDTDNNGATWVRTKKVTPSDVTIGSGGSSEALHDVAFEEVR